jgi:hypothetical protein
MDNKNYARRAENMDYLNIASRRGLPLNENFVITNAAGKSATRMIDDVFGFRRRDPVFSDMFDVPRDPSERIKHN